VKPNVDPVTSTDPDSPTSEGMFHNYRTNAIPFAVHIIWILFWIGAVYYLVQYLLPALRMEIVTPP
jgi:hypothetical protein